MLEMQLHIQPEILRLRFALLSPLGRSLSEEVLSVGQVKGCDVTQVVRGLFSWVAAAVTAARGLGCCLKASPRT